jgi:hypothetical protein
MEKKNTSVLCDLANEGKRGDIKRLALDPEYICSGCGRIADDEESLCSPVSLEDV